MCRHRGVETVVAHAQIQGHLLYGPLVLREDPDGGGVLHHLERDRPDPDGLGHRVPEGVVPGAENLVRVVVGALAPEVIPLQVVAGFERVRPGDIRGRDAIVELVHEPSSEAAGPGIVGRLGAVVEVQRKILNPDIVRAHFHLRSGVFVQDVRRRACLEQ